MKKITILLFAVAVVASGCKKFTNINSVNPNQPTTVTPNVVLSAALVGSGNAVATGYLNTARWMGYLSRSGNYIETVPTETYVIDPSYEDADFQAAYGLMQQYNYIEHNSAGDPFYVGVAKVMKAFHFGTLVDAFGDVPYTQAFNLNKYPNPAYDKAATIYAAIITQCDSAVYYFQKASTFYGTASSVILTNDAAADVMFGKTSSSSTRMNEWIRFTNTVKLRLLMTVRQAGGTFTTSYIQGEIDKATADGQGYISQSNTTTLGNDETASVNPGYTTSSQGQLSPFYGVWETNTGSSSQNAAFLRASQYYINNAYYQNDTFSDIYSQVAGLSPLPWAGNYDGDPASVSNSGTSTIFVDGTGTYGLCRSPTQNQWIMTDIESLFWQAEAVYAGFTGVSNLTAQKLTQEGVEQQYVMVNDEGSTPAADVADADGYIAEGAGDPRFDATGSAFGIRSIMTLKWQSVCMINWEQAYTDYRRLGYPVPETGSTPIFGFSHANNVAQHAMLDATGKSWPVSLPFRFLYPSSEIATNGKNVPGGVTAYTPIFWDAREK